MFLLDWYQQWLVIRAQYKGQKINLNREEKEVEICQSCETLRQQLEIANYEKDKLLNKILEKPEAPKEATTAPAMIHRPRMIPWAVRKQMLEREDKEKARSLRNAAQPDVTAEETQKFEEELNNATQTREATTDAETKN